jgi:cytochrome c5
MGKHEDKLFMRRFSLVIAALVVVTIVIIFIAASHDYNGQGDDYPSQRALAAARIQPIGAVRTELPESTTADASSTAQVGTGQTASAGGTQEAMDGAAVYASVCQVCHQAGAAGAPIPGSDAWAERAGKGAEALYASAVNGLNAMPAKGGRMDLTDAEVEAAVDYMLEQ